MENVLFYKQSAKCFEEALPLGNGRLGATVFGNLKKERIALNEDSLWSGYPKNLNNEKAHEYLPRLREAVFSEDFETAKGLVNREFHGNWCESYLPFGDLIIDYKGKFSKKNYERRLDISRGVATVSSEGLTETVFVSNPAQLIVINIKSQNPVSFDIHFESQLKNKTYTKEDALVISGSAPEVCAPPYYNNQNPIVYGKRGMRFTGVAKVLGQATFEGNAIKVRSQREVTVLLSLATSFVSFNAMPTADSERRALAYFENIKSFGCLLEEHKAYFARYFDRVNFTLEGSKDGVPTDKRLREFQKDGSDYGLTALLFQYGRYLLISSSAPGSNAANLQGIWNLHLRAPWSSNYTLNINTQMNYWCADICNLSEFFMPLTDLVKKFAVKGMDTAKAYYACPGWCVHHNSDIWGNTNPAGHPNGDGDDSLFSVWNTSGPWLLNMLWEHYEYTRDEEFKQEIKPLFEGCLEFYNAYLVEKDGELVTCPSLSPENAFVVGGREYATTYMPSMDREVLHEFFINCEKMGLNAPKIKQVNPASDGRIPEWIKEYEEKWKTHRHLSHLYCIYPSASEASEELKQAAKKSLLVRGFGGTGWSLGWKVCLWARLGNGDNAYRLIRQQLHPVNPRFDGGKGGSYPNLLGAHPPFQIDGNFAASAGIAEMIKNNAMPSSWNGQISGLKLKEGILSAKIENGVLKDKTIVPY